MPFRGPQSESAPPDLVRGILLLGLQMLRVLRRLSREWLQRVLRRMGLLLPRVQRLLRMLRWLR